MLWEMMMLAGLMLPTYNGIKCDNEVKAHTVIAELPPYLTNLVCGLNMGLTDHGRPFNPKTMVILGCFQGEEFPDGSKHGLIIYNGMPKVLEHELQHGRAFFCGAPQPTDSEL